MKIYIFSLSWVMALAVGSVVLWQKFPVHRVQLEQTVSHAGTEEKTVLISEPIQPLPHIQLDQRKAALGNRLFHDTRLSTDNTVSCATCHNLSKGGTDRLAFSLGVNDTVGRINSPTVYNSGFNFAQFWDGRSATLEEQVSGPIHSPKEMASNWDEVVGKLEKDVSYPKAFADLYSDGITGDNIADAIATFERSLVTVNSRFDQYLRGHEDAITEDEKEGYRLFKDFGCIVCHQGVNVGGNMYQTFGKFGDYFADRGDIKKDDLGRFNVTGKERDRHKFKVPSLRVVTLTPPYFHDGTAETLEEAVQTMAKYQLGSTLTDEEVDLIIQFFHTLTGEYDGKQL